MKSRKDKSVVNLCKEDGLAAISPLKKKKKKRPMPFMAFSSFARYNIFSQARPQIPDYSSRPSLMLTQEDTLNPKNSKLAEQMESSSDSEMNSEEDEEVVEEETVQVDFDFFDPKQDDFHGVKLLLKRYLDTFQWDLSGFVDLILTQTTVGTVVKSPESDNDSDENNQENDVGELFAVITALNLGRYFDQTCVKDLKKYLISVCNEESTKSKLIKLLEKQDKDLGLLVCERLVNCPYELVLKLYGSLFDEISWATEDEPTSELRDSYRFKTYLLVTKYYENRKTKGSQDEPIIYVKEEDEILREICSWSFTFELSAEEPVPSELKNYKKMGLVMVAKAEDISKFRDKFQRMIE